MPTGTLPLSTDDVAKLSAAAAHDVPDPQLAKALELVTTEAAASR
jgi:hypothetical protein